MKTLLRFSLWHALLAIAYAGDANPSALPADAAERHGIVTPPIAMLIIHQSEPNGRMAELTRLTLHPNGHETKATSHTETKINGAPVTFGWTVKARLLPENLVGVILERSHLVGTKHSADKRTEHASIVEHRLSAVIDSHEKMTVEGLGSLVFSVNRAGTGGVTDKATKETK